MLWIIGGGDVVKSFSKVWNTPVTETLYQQMEHAGWEGFQFLDLIFPLFLFLVVIGMNSITIWVGQRCIDFTYTAGFIFDGMLRYAGAVKPVLAAFSVLMLKWLSLYFLHQHKIHLKA